MGFREDVLPEVKSNIPVGYDGRCKLILQASYSEEYVVFPNFEEAEKAAYTAIEPVVGGYGDATIEVTNDNITHETAEEWLID